MSGKNWPGFYHLSEDGMVRKCYAQVGNCKIGMHSTSEKELYEESEAMNKKITVALPIRKNTSLTSEDSLGTQFNNRVSKDTNNQIVQKHNRFIKSDDGGENVVLKEVTYKSDNPNYSHITIRQNEITRQYTYVNGRKRIMNDMEKRIRESNTKRLEQLTGSVNQRAAKISEISKQNGLRVFLRTGRSKKSYLKLLQASDNRERNEISIISKNLKEKIHSESETRSFIILHNSENVKEQGQKPVSEDSSPIGKPDELGRIVIPLSTEDGNKVKIENLDYDLIQSLITNKNHQNV